MLKFERTDKQVSLEMNGNLLEIMADITLLLKVVYEHLEKKRQRRVPVCFQLWSCRTGFSGVGRFAASRRTKGTDDARCRRFDQASGGAERNGSR